MTTTPTPAELANDIKAAINELAEGRVFPDLIEAVETLASLAATAGEPVASSSEYQRGWDACMVLWADHMKRVNNALNATPKSGWANRTAEVHENVSEALAHPPAAQAGWDEDGELLDWLRDETCDLRCVNIPTGGDDYAVRWQVVSHWQSKPYERVEAQSYTEDPRDAIRAAIDAARVRAKGERG